jgi:hypothetical protein
MSHRWKKSKRMGAKSQTMPQIPPVIEQPPVSATLPVQVSPESSRQMQISVAFPTPFPATRCNLILCNQWQGDDPRNRAQPSGAPGGYTVTFVLVRFQQAMSTVEAEEADSLIRVPAAGSAPRLDLPYINVDWNTGQETFQLEGYVNANSRLAAVVVRRVAAASFSDAAEKAERVVYGLLDRLAVRFHVPLTVGKVEVVEAATSNVRVSMIMPYNDAALDNCNFTLSGPDSDLFASFYREALNASSPAYRFLCMYKIIDGVFARRRRITRTPQGHQAKWYRSEVVPGELGECAQWLTELFGRSWDDTIAQAVGHPEVRGRKFSYIDNSYLLPIRVQVAHSVLKSGEPTLPADEPLHLNQIYRWLPLTQCIARHMLKNEFPGDF